ncbi:hypothetical protein [Crenalkalicoccus roseus]|uniref:hypothetical protein n=1 Tax=Crenalkalicoccus roseus TaxID=1485588 RepID=UPI001081D223|nr:hypothetical protein [Crenalkalicoccus roseus]
MARVTAKGLQIGAEARGPGAGTLGLAGQRRDVARMLGGGLGQRGGVRLRGAGGHRRDEAGGVALAAEVPGGQRRHGAGRCQTDRQGMPTEQPKDRRAGHG